MDTTRHVWQIPADEFIGVPYVFHGGAHPHREQSVATGGRLADYKRHQSAPHRLLPRGLSVASMADGKGYVLIDSKGAPVGLYHRRMQGYLLRLRDDLREQGVGYRFLAACLDLLDVEAGKCVWAPGTYSDRGLRASLRAHRILVDDAVERGMPVSEQVLEKRGWVPEIVPARSLNQGDIAELERLAIPDLDYKEVMVAIAMLAGKAARLEALVDSADPVGRPETFVLCLGADVYQGFERVKKDDVIAEAVRHHAEYGRGRGGAPAEFVFQRVSLESLCGHKNTDRDRARDFLRTIITEKNTAGLEESLSSTRSRLRPGR
jgi:hypothetical protein